MSIEIEIECEGCGQKIKSEFQSAYMVVTVKQCETCKEKFIKEALENFYNDLDRVIRNLADKYDIK